LFLVIPSQKLFSTKNIGIKIIQFCHHLRPRNYMKNFSFGRPPVIVAHNLDRLAWELPTSSNK
jgi:hypothetical protein